LYPNIYTGSPRQAQSALAGYDGAMLIVSHDRDFLRAVGVTARLTLGSARIAEAPPSGGCRA
jgi:ATPase subunit of ABC transporter with duplicated ATPase domains